MSSLPTGLVAGNYYPVYDGYYKQMDPSNSGSIGAAEAARFLKKSGLSDTVLSKIWDIADSNGKGYLTKSGFFIALKLVALVQAGKEISNNNLSLDVPPPNMGGVIVNSIETTVIPNGNLNKTMPIPVVPPTVLSTSDWAMKPQEKMKYDKLFDSLQPSNGVVPGNKVKGVLMDSKLPIDTLGRIWDLADMDEDGALDRHEFCVAMHLVYKALEKYAIPSTLPQELLPPNKRKSSIPPASAIPVLPAVPVSNGIRSATPDIINIGSTVPLIPSCPTPPLIATAAVNITPSHQIVAAKSEVDVARWVIGPDEKLKSDMLFRQADLDQDGFVSGHEIKNVFLQSGVAQPVLAKIWALCDTSEQGKLNSEQFALALWLISRKLKGQDPPAVLSPEMVPPSCRPRSDSSVLTPPQQEIKKFTNPEIEALSADIEKLVNDRMTLEQNVLSKKADLKIKSGEATSLQGELDALLATLKQLETQRVEAQKRLIDLKKQTTDMESEFYALTESVEADQKQVDKLRQQADEQDTVLKSQEIELERKKQELDELNKEEADLNKKCSEIQNEISNLDKLSVELKPQVDEVKELVLRLREFHQQISDANLHLDSIIESNDVTNLMENTMNLEPKFRDSSYTPYVTQIKNENVGGKVDNNFQNDAFGNSISRYKQDPFAGTNNDPFTSEFNQSKSRMSGFDSDPFTSMDSSKNKQQPDSFSDRISDSRDEVIDPFGSDPFAVLHAPPKVISGSTTPSPSFISATGATTIRSESPSPALPPKKCKQPPPRPAPPRPAPPAAVASGFDSDFADFSNFSSKSSTTSSASVGFNWNTSSSSKYDSASDPFRDYRYEDPFSIADTQKQLKTQFDSHDPFFSSDPFSSSSSVKSCNGVTSLTSPTSPLPSEDEQLAWATAESVKLETERKKMTSKEKADLKLALKLSKSTNSNSNKKKSSFRSKILS